MTANGGFDNISRSSSRKWKRRQQESVLSRLLPNIGRPKATVRKMYVNILHSMLLYRAPIWADRMREDRLILTLVHRTQRIMAIRVARCYRTVSYRAATTLSGTPPVELLAKMYQQVYRRIKILRKQVGIKRDCHSEDSGQKTNVYPVAKVPG